MLTKMYRNFAIVCHAFQTSVITGIYQGNLNFDMIIIIKDISFTIWKTTA